MKLVFTFSLSLFLSRFSSLFSYSSSICFPLLFLLYFFFFIFLNLRFLVRFRAGGTLRTTSLRALYICAGNKVHRVKRNETWVIRTPKCNTLYNERVVRRGSFLFSLYVYFFFLSLIFFFNFFIGSTLTTSSYKSKNVRSKQQEGDLRYLGVSK